MHSETILIERALQVKNMEVVVILKSASESYGPMSQPSPQTSTGKNETTVIRSGFMNATEIHHQIQVRDPLLTS